MPIKRLLAALVIGLLYLCETSYARTYAVCAGIARYKSDNISNLSKPEKDARAVAEFYRRAGADVELLTGYYADKQHILSSMRKQFAKAGADDRIVFYFSGHGYKGGMCAYDFDGGSGALSYTEILGTMGTSKASVRIVFADACFSGALREVKFSDSDSVQSLMFLSSRGSETSEESAFVANGLFTKYLLRGLGGAADSNADMTVTPRELFDYVNREVKERTDGRQHPVMWGNFNDNLPLVRYRRK